MIKQQPGNGSEKIRRGGVCTREKVGVDGILYIVVAAIAVIVAFLWLDEVLDIPHCILGAPPTLVNWREAIVETLFILWFGIFVLLLLRKNIRSRKKAEQERFTAVSNAVNATGAGLLTYNRYGRITFVNHAFEIFREKGKFDLLFSDVILSVMPGTELVNRILKINPEIPIVLTSGYMNQMSDSDVLRKEKLIFLGKPYSMDDLLKTIARTLLKGQR